MSLSWRKRQALASDQKTWRGLGLDSALWTSIERNAGTATAALKPSTTSGTTGIVTGLRLVKTEGLDFNNTGELTVYASDASNSSVASTVGVNLFDTPHPSSNSGSGLIFTIKKYGAEDFQEASLNTDISGMKYYINSGGSGYKVGDDIIIQGAQQTGRVQSISQLIVTNGRSQYDELSQDAYKVFDISCTPDAAGVPASAGSTVEIKLGIAPGTVTSTGILTADVTTSSTQTIRVHAATDQTFDYLAPATGYSLEINSVPATDYGPGTGSDGAITEISTNPQRNGFVGDVGGVTTGSNQTITLHQTESQALVGEFAKVYSAIKSGSTTVVTAANAGAGTYNTPTYGTIRPNSAPTSGSTLIDGRLTARVTSVANTDPQQGRN